MGGDPVYPTKRIPAALLSTFPLDWRTAGRALLSLGMSALEGRRLRTKGAVLKWQKQGSCGALCGEQCAKSPDRIMCAWRVPGTVHEHHNRMDALLLGFKGHVHHTDITEPIWRVQRQVALKNRYHSERMVWDKSEGSYVFAEREPIHPAFGLRPDRNDDHYADGELTYD